MEHPVFCIFAIILLHSLSFNLIGTARVMSEVDALHREPQNDPILSDNMPTEQHVNLARPRLRIPAKNSSVTEASSGQTVTVVVQLNGELGNQLHGALHGFCVQRVVEEQLGLKTKIMLRTQKNSEWRKAVESTKAAFPNFRLFDTREVNTEVFDTVHRIQEEWMDSLLSTGQLNLTNIDDPNALKVHSCSTEKCLSDLVNLLNQTLHTQRPKLPDESPAISIPHIYSDAYIHPYCIEKMHDELKDFLTVDEEAICRQIPDPDEAVFHFRDYNEEFQGEVRTEQGYEEADPNLMATQLFADYRPGDKVAIISRFQENTEEYIKALREHKGIEARYIQNQTGNQDFCFLLKAQQEIVASRKSTIAFWAAFLGNSKLTRLYTLSTPETRRKDVDFFEYSYRNENLRDRIRYENYNKSKE
eukprot:scaffold4703_cov108-Cylindrotheca_fusiformis.AAC.6